MSVYNVTEDLHNEILIIKALNFGQFWQLVNNQQNYGSLYFIKQNTYNRQRQK